MQNTQNEQFLSSLLVASQGGDSQSYHQFLVEASELLKPFIRRKVKSVEIIDDVLQDTLLAIHKSRHSYLPERSVLAWMFVICEHRIIDFYRQFRRLEKREIQTFADIEVEQIEHPHSILLEELLQRLPLKQREVIELLKFQGLSIKEVSAKTGLSESAVKVTTFRGYEAMKRLKGVLENE